MCLVWLQLEELIKDDERSGLLKGKVDQILMALYFQLRMAYSTHMADEEIDKKEVVQLYRSLGAMFLSVSFSAPLLMLCSILVVVLLDCNTFRYFSCSNAETCLWKRLKAQ